MGSRERRSTPIPVIPPNGREEQDLYDTRTQDDPEQPSSSWSSFFPSSFPRANSFGSLLLRSRLEEENATVAPNDEIKYTSNNNHNTNRWSCVSPMTHHVIREPHQPSPTRIRKRRSRSFSDYIDSSREELLHRPHPTASLKLPTLAELQPPKKPLHVSPVFPLQEATHIASQATTVSEMGDAKLSNGSLQSFDDSNNIPPSKSQQQSEEDEQDYLPPPPSSSSEHPFLISILYGMINATIVIPVVMSFGNIIYQDARFQPYTPVLIKLTMVSGVVHQLCFSSLSSLKFAVGSVQDAGLIFLSSMASDIVAYCQANGHNEDEVILATVTVGLAVAAFVLGIGLIMLGKLQLAGYVQMLPTCVVAGYLAFIGFFCGKSGLGLMANISVSNDDDGTSISGNVLTWELLVDHWLYVLPGLMGGIFIYISVRTFQHVAVLPTCIAILLLLFYFGLAIAGSSIEQATDRGWISQAEPAPVWYRTWDYLQLDKVVWSALPQLALTEVSMLFVVGLSSSLDVAAIELELARPLNYNAELIMVGISNVVSGLTGGYTGSYIFSQSIFSLRSGINSRVAGFCLAFCQALVIILPFPILSFVPNFFYGSLLGMICLDLMIEWLWDFRSKVTIAEYLIGLSTFGLIQWLGVEYGILSGVGLYVALRQLGIPVGVLKMVTNETEEEQEQQEVARLLLAKTKEQGSTATMMETSPLLIDGM